MSVTREQVEAKAKELGLTLTPEQIAAHILIGRLPEKDSASSSGDNGGDNGGGDDEKDLTAGMRLRLNKEKEKTKAAKEVADAALAKVKEFEEKNNETSRKESEKKGEYDKLIAAANTAKTDYETKAKELKERAKSTAIEGSVRLSLLTAGVPADRLPKAVRLFELEKVVFEWKDENAFTYEIDEDALKITVEDFKKDNPFMFEVLEDESNLGGFNPRKQPSQPKGGDAEKTKAAFKAKHPRIFG